MPLQSELEEKILTALQDTRWDYRTVQGIANETGLSQDFVQQFLESRNDVVWKSSIPDKQGRDLYRLYNRHSKSKEFWRNLSTSLFKSSFSPN